MKVLTFSRVFPAYHPKAGQPTYFVEKILHSFKTRHYELLDSARPLIDHEFFLHNYQPKYHTIRKGNRWKVGDFFCPRVWGNDVNPKTSRSGPYQSKQISFSIWIQVKKVWDIEMDKDGVFKINGKYFDVTSGDFSCNDGLSADDLLNWFPIGKPFTGQIICWNDEINY